MPDEPEDFQPTREFLRRLAKRDRVAVTTLARECAGPLLDHLRRTQGRHGRPKEEWYDIVQDVLAKFIAKDAPIDPSRPLLPYLRHIALNRARDLAKEATRRDARERQVGQQRLRTAIGVSPLANLVATEANRLVEAKLSTLGDGDQRVLRTFMQNDDGRHIVAIAESEQIDRGAAQMRYTRALKRLRAMMEEDDRESGIRA
jgi:RNA polymerase sigma factor (sigma-70 family)